MSPIYESEELSREDLDKLRRKNKCKECGGRLDVFLDFDTGKAFLACSDYRRTGHEGIEREPSRYEKGGLSELNLETRREIVAEEHGVEKTKALSRYIGTGAMTKAIATEIVETLWGEAPAIEKGKAILLCSTYQLNPLMKHLYLVPYKRRDKEGEYILDKQGKAVQDWSMQMGIGATRLLAQRKHNYSYLDMTPRKATPEEVKKILGETADPNFVYGFVHIKDVDTKAEAFGLRGISITDKIKGVEKGNTHLNMACVRAERLALDRQYPGEMPQDVEIIDERFIEGDYKVLDVKPEGEEPEGTTEPEAEPSAEEQDANRVLGSETTEHWCKEHNCAFQLKTSRFGGFYSHKVKGGWCNEKKEEEEPTKPAAETEAEKPTKPARDPETIRSLNDLYKACNEDWKLQPDQVCKELGVSSQTEISETPADCYRRIAAVMPPKG